jgi:hypothetical protein
VETSLVRSRKTEANEAVALQRLEYERGRS